MNRSYPFFLTLILMLWCGPAMSTVQTTEWDPDGATAIDLDTFRRIPVLEGGRKMPMDTFARNRLLQFSGRTRLEGEAAVSWLARVFFAPETLQQDAIFLIEDPETAQALGLDTVHRERHTVNAILTALPRLEEIVQKAGTREADARSRVENELFRLYLNIIEYMELINAFAFAQPVDAFAVDQMETRLRLGLDPEAEAFSYLDIFRAATGLRPLIGRFANVPGTDRTAVEEEALRLSLNLYEWGHFYRDQKFVMIPIQAGDEERWISAWAVLGGDGKTRDPELLLVLDTLQDMTRAYRRGDQAGFDRAARDFRQFVQERLPDDRDLQWIDLEVRKNDLNPFMLTRVFYLLAFLFALGALFALPETQQANRVSKILRWIAFGLCAFALLPHTAGLIMRILIMDRPPVTNLYGTFVFVAWACALLGLIVERIQRNLMGLLAGAFAGIALLMISGYFAADGDTMGKVVAVLSSNFWLTTHVMVITLGYAGCVIAGLIGHAYLIVVCVAPGRQSLLDSLQRAIYGVLGFGWIFTWFGTMLGGVWADQSWGRFWGWDPKENGALLIILWVAILLHARIAGMIGPIGLAAGSALGIIFVMLAWLGVNLLGVGLHSYGFTSGLAFGLNLYIALQLLVLLVLTPLASRALKTLGRKRGQ